jgi:hypothetical protein
VQDVSDVNFAIRGIINVTGPTLNEELKVTGSKAITWTKTGTKITNVEIRYSTNGGSTYPNVIVASTDAGLGTYTWTPIPDAICDTVKVKISDVDDPSTTVYGESAVCSIVGGITVTAPALNADWPVNTSRNITWTKTGSIVNLKIYYSSNNGASYTLIDSVPGTQSSYAWTIPDAVSNTALIKVADAAKETTVYDASDVFHIAANFTVNTPGDGEVLVVGSSYDITWARQGSAVTQVKLEYSSNGGADWEIINAIAANNGIYPWTIPDALSTSCKVRVSDPNNANAKDESEGNFKIKGSLTVTSPNNGTESWNAGSTYPITWIKQGSISTINIYYSHNNGTDWTKLNTLAVDASLGTWNWSISEI